MKISTIVKYKRHRMAKVNHHKWGEEKRQLFTEVNSNICAVRNQASVMNDARSDTLDHGHIVMYCGMQ